MTMIALRRRAAVRRLEKKASQRLRRLESGALQVISQSRWWWTDLRQHLERLKPDELSVLADGAKDDRIRETAIRMRSEGRGSA
jgi:hypothetical protein